MLLKKLKLELAYDSKIPLLVINLGKKKKKHNSKRYMHANVHSSMIYNSLYKEAT